MSGILWRPVHADAPTARCYARDCRVNSGSQGCEIAIMFGGNNARMIRPPPVKALKMSSVECQHGTTLRVSTGQNIEVRRCCSAIFLCGQDVVAKLAKNFDYRIVEVLVSVQQGHRRLALP
jgi:hypothetical protein